MGHLQRKGFFSRLTDLWRGMWGVELKKAEARNAEAVYHNAIAEHVKHHDRLKDAIGRMVYLRNRVEADLKERQVDLALVVAALNKATVTSDDDRALVLIRHRKQLGAEVERLREELTRLAAQTEKSKGGLVEVNAAIKRLKVEREEMLARKAHALARRDAQVALQHLKDTGHLNGALTALESVRESIFQLEQSVDLDTEVDVAATGEITVAALRLEAAEEEDRNELARLKHELGANLLCEAKATNGNGGVLEPVEVSP
ncbi:MAG: hypothetical protein V3T05_14680 [Myxococcota bacterium]